MANANINHPKKIFEEADEKSLGILSLVSGVVGKYLVDFKPIRLWNRSFNALAYQPSSKMNIGPLCLQSSAYDALYVNREKNKPLLLIYVTPHIICYHFENGLSTLDSLYRGVLDFDIIAASPAYKFRSHDNKSVEFINCRDGNSNLEDLLSDIHPTMGLYCEKEQHPKGRNLLPPYLKFLAEIKTFFEKTLYLPYLIHPYRLLLNKNGGIKLISCQLLQQITYPHMSVWKVTDANFSHPSSFNAQPKSGDVSRGLIRDSLHIILDFLHSAFITTLWLYNTAMVNRNFTCLPSMTEVKTTVKPKTTIFWAPPNNTDRAGESFQCNDRYGFCLSFSSGSNSNCSISSIVHDYGCRHLQVFAPKILTTAIENAASNENVDILIEIISKEISVLEEFISSLQRASAGGD